MTLGIESGGALFRLQAGLSTSFFFVLQRTSPKHDGPEPLVLRNSNLYQSVAITPKASSFFNKSLFAT
jgi:hypothetical protein